jgi:hypothetical protein
LNTGPTRGKALVQFGQLPFEIVVHQRNRQIGGALDDLNAEVAQGAAEFGGAAYVDRFDAHPAIAEILFRDSRRQAEARPKAARGTARSAG